MGDNCGYIYKITNMVNNKVYIGKTKKYYGKSSKRIRGINARFKRHINDAINHKDHCPYLCKAIRKHGADNFSVEQLTMCKLELTSALETAFISFYKSTGKLCNFCQFCAILYLFYIERRLMRWILNADAGRR